MACYTWGEVNLLSKYELLQFQREGFFKDIFTKADSAKEFMNYKGVCRTALATPDLLNMESYNRHKIVLLYMSCSDPNRKSDKMFNANFY